MTPYYSDDLVTLYLGDCREVTDWLAADVLVTDPPYGIAWSVPQGAFNSERGRRKHDVGHAGIANDSDVAARDDILRLWGSERPAVVFGSLLLPPPADTKQTLVWHKPDNSGIFGAIGGWRRDVEAIYLLGRWPRIPAGRSSVVRTNTVALGTYIARSGHPHAKPIDLMESLISTATGVVADPFVGGGATLVAAKLLGRKAIGVELEERYCEIAARRLAQDVLDFEGATA
jgi:hypothetical protein